MINLVVDPLLIPILVMIVAELFRVESRVSRLEEKFEQLLRRYKNAGKN